MELIKNPAVDTKPSINWDIIIKKWKLSKQTQREFCISRGLNYGTFVYHRCKKIGRKKQSNKTDPTFKEVCLPTIKKPIAPVLLKLRLPSGVYFEIPEKFSPKQLKQVLSILGVVYDNA